MMKCFALLSIVILAGGCGGSAKDGVTMKGPPREVDYLLSQMELANVVFNAPPSMNLYETAPIELALSLDTPIDELQRQIEASGDPRIASVRVSRRMEARLTGANFQISAITPEVQAISRSEITKWKWEVKPTENGPWRLHLTLSALLQVEGESTPRAIRTFDEEIDVQVTLRQRATLFFENNWQWLFATILIPLVLWCWKNRKAAKATPTNS